MKQSIKWLFLLLSIMLFFSISIHAKCPEDCPTQNESGEVQYEQSWITCLDSSGPTELATGESATYIDSEGNQLVFTMTADSENCGYKKLSEMPGYNLNCDMIVRNTSEGHWRINTAESCGGLDSSLGCVTINGLKKYEVYLWCAHNTNWGGTTPCGEAPCNYEIPDGWTGCGINPETGESNPYVASPSAIKHYDWVCN